MSHHISKRERISKLEIKVSALELTVSTLIDTISSIREELNNTKSELLKYTSTKPSNTLKTCKREYNIKPISPIPTANNRQNNELEPDELLPWGDITWTTDDVVYDKL